jgi:hypothetical protein
MFTIAVVDLRLDGRITLNRSSRDRARYLAWIYLTQQWGQTEVAVDTLVKLSSCKKYKMYFILVVLLNEIFVFVKESYFYKHDFVMLMLFMSLN